MGFTLLGIKQAQAKLEDYVNVMSRNQKQALEEIGQRGEDIVTKNTPTVSGRLKQSMDHKTYKDFVEVGTNVEYADDVEFRSRQNKGFFLRSFNQLVPIARTIYKTAMEVKR